MTTELPQIGKVARRELAAQGITTLDDAARRTEDELRTIHGVGPKAIRILKEALAARGETLAP